MKTNSLQSILAYDDLENLNLDSESTSTSYMFVANLILMIISILTVMSIVGITVIVYLADDEV